MLSYRSDYLFSYEVNVTTPDVIGPCPGDIRLNFGLTGGEVRGPRLQGKVRPGGGDFATLRSDGVILVDVRGLLESHDGALIDIAYTGMIDLGPEGYTSFLKGEMPATLKIRVAPRLRTAHPAYQWLNRLQCYAIGEADLAQQKARYDVYGLG